MLRIVGTAEGITIESNGNNRVFQVDGNVTASLSGLTITGGGGNADGGGLIKQGNLTLSLCTITGNSSTSGRGRHRKLWVSHARRLHDQQQRQSERRRLCKLRLGEFERRCTLSDNTATWGKGFFAENLPGHPAENATLTKCTLSGNTAGQKGSSLSNQNGVISMTDCTVSGNSAPSGGGLFNARSANLLATIVAGNTNGSNIPSDIAGSGKASGSFNLIGVGGSGGLKNRRRGNIVLTSLKRLLLAPLGRFGGPTQTMALLPGSRAIGNGTSVRSVSTDQRGFAQPLPMPTSERYRIRASPSRSSRLPARGERKSRGFFGGLWLFE